MKGFEYNDNKKVLKIRTFISEWTLSNDNCTDLDIVEITFSDLLIRCLVFINVFKIAIKLYEIIANTYLKSIDSVIKYTKLIE